jgi:hypothetical protein
LSDIAAFGRLLFTRLAGGYFGVVVWGFQPAVPFRVDLLLTPRQHVLRRDVAGVPEHDSSSEADTASKIPPPLSGFR